MNVIAGTKRVKDLARGERFLLAGAEFVARSVLPMGISSVQLRARRDDGAEKVMEIDPGVKVAVL